MKVDIYILHLNSFQCSESCMILPNRVKIKMSVIKSDKKRIEYIASQWLRHKILSELLGIKINRLKFAETKTGRPYLINEKNIDFNISHTGSYVVMAVTKNQNIGIDVQQQVQKRQTHLLSIAKRYLDKKNITLLNLKRIEVMQENTFYWTWVYKEATLKLKGEGIANHLNKVFFSY